MQTVSRDVLDQTAGQLRSSAKLLDDYRGPTGQLQAAITRQEM